MYWVLGPKAFIVYNAVRTLGEFSFCPATLDYYDHLLKSSVNRIICGLTTSPPKHSNNPLFAFNPAIKTIISDSILRNIAALLVTSAAILMLFFMNGSFSRKLTARSAVHRLLLTEQH